MRINKFFSWLSKNKSEIIKGIIPLVIVELILWGIFFLPPSIKENLVLHKNYTNFIDLLGTNYVHESLWHILGNSITFPLIAFPLLLVLLRFGGNIKTFYKLLLINLLIVPILTSVVIFQMNRTIFYSNTRSLGFSVINASFMGSFAVTYVCRGLSKLKLKKFLYFISLILLAVLMFVLVYSKYVPHEFLMKVVPLLSILILLCIIAIFLTIPKDVANRIDKKFEKRKMFKRFAVFYNIIYPYAVVIIYSSILFPANLIVNGSLVGFYNHFVGFVLGIMITFCFYEYIDRKIQRSKKFFYFIIAVLFAFIIFFYIPSIPKFFQSMQPIYSKPINASEIRGLLVKYPPLIESFQRINESTVEVTSGNATYFNSSFFAVYPLVSEKYLPNSNTTKEAYDCLHPVENGKYFWVGVYKFINVYNKTFYYGFIDYYAIVDPLSGTTYVGSYDDTRNIKTQSDCINLKAFRNYSIGNFEYFPNFS